MARREDYQTIRNGDRRKISLYMASTKRVAIYARVSTDNKGQDPENQLLQLRAIGYVVVREYVDRESGAKGTDQRKQFGRLFADAARREFDMVLVWFTRNGMAATVVDLQRLNSYGVSFSFHSYSEPHLSTDNELVRDVLLAVLASLAKLEREKISQRTKAGLERARAKGERLGRPAFSTKAREKLRAALDRGNSWHAVSIETGIPYSTVKKHARALGYEPRWPSAGEAKTAHG
jgi:DNA invertase Pin-like site-specific DNA recombinase